MLTILLILLFIRPFICSLAFPSVNFVYSILLIAALFIWVIIKGLPLKLIKPIAYPFAFFILALLISVIFSHNKIISVNGLYSYVSGILLFLFSVSLSSKEKSRVLLSIVAAAVLISLLVIYQYFFLFKHILAYLAKQKISNEFILDYISQRRPFAPFVTPNTLGGYLAMIIPLTLIYKNKIWLILLLSSALLLSRSIGALISIFLAVVIYFYLQGKFEKRRILFLCGLLALLGFVFITRMEIQKQHLKPIFSTVMRLNYWRDALKIIQSSPFKGVGLGNFNLAQSRYAHNSYLQIWTEMGILGLASFLWLIFVVFKQSLGRIKNSVYKTQILALTLANAVFLMHNFVDFSFFLPEVALIWWVALGLLFSYTNTNS